MRTLRAWSLIPIIVAAVCIPNGQAKAQTRSGILVGKAAPQFQVQGIFHERYSLETFKGHILVMQFGTSW